MFKKQRSTPVRKRPLRQQATPPAVQYYRSSAASAVRTPEERVSEQQRPRRRPDRSLKQLGSHIGKLPTYISLLAIVGSIVYCSILGNVATVLLPADSGLFPKQHYSDVASKLLQKSVFNHSKLTFNASAFKDELVRSLPEAADVSVSVPFVGRKPVVGLSLVEPAFVFSASSGSYVIGTNGVALANTHEVIQEKIASLMLLQEDVPMQISVGKPVMTTADIVFIKTVVKGLQDSGINIASMTLPVGASELYVRPSGVPYTIKFALNGDVRQQVGDYLAVKNYVGDTPPQEYIDVRVGERAFVK